MLLTATGAELASATNKSRRATGSRSTVLICEVTPSSGGCSRHSVPIAHSATSPSPANATANAAYPPSATGATAAAQMPKSAPVSRHRATRRCPPSPMRPATDTPCA